MIKTLNTKQAPGYTDDEGNVWPEHTLCRFTDENGEGGCWFESLKRAETSWERWIAGAPARARRAAENERYKAAVANLPDPFARFDA
jgi:hypothetical protein